MGEAMVDSLRIYERLKATRGRDALVREIAGVFGELVDTKLATKHDLDRLRSELQADIEKLRISTEARIDAKGMEVKHDLIRWVAGMLLAQAGLIAAIVKLA